METIYLVGGNGFIGKNLSRYLYDHYQIVIIDKYIDKHFFITYPHIILHEIDLVNNDIIPLTQPDYIINLASVVTAERDISLFDTLVSSNLKVLINLYEQFKSNKELKLFIQFGSSEEYGMIHSPFIESERESPNSPYALIKQLTTNTSMMLYNNYRFPITIVRPGNLYGPMQNETKFLPYIIHSLCKNETINVTGCEQKRDFIYVDDFSYLIKKILDNYTKVQGEIINVSSGESISLKEIINICKKELGSTSTINYGAIPYRKNEIMDLHCSMQKLAELLNENIFFDTRKRLQDYISELKA